MKFVKRPIEYEAVQWDGTERGFAEVIAPFAGDISRSYLGVEHSVDVYHRVTFSADEHTLTIPGLMGFETVRPGDWIIRHGNDLEVRDANGFHQAYKPVAS